MGLVNLHLYPSDFTHESRMLRETQAVLDAGVVSEVLIGATWSEGLARTQHYGPDREVHRIATYFGRRAGGRFTKLAAHLEWMVRVLWRFGRRRVDVVSCHSLTVLPLGAVLRVLRGATLVYTPHELETEVATPPIPRSVGRVIEERFIGLADTVIVVGGLIGEWYADRYELDDVAVVRNIPLGLEGSAERTNLLREKLAIPHDELIFLYQGGIHDGRGITLLLAAFTQVPADRHIVFLGYGGLADHVEAVARERTNVHYLPAVPPEELPHYTAGADVGLSLIENISLSYYYSLPNKLFEYMQAGIPVISSDFPEVARLHERHDFGWLTPVEADGVAKVVASITHDDLAIKRAAVADAARELSWENEQGLLTEAYRAALEARS